MTQNIDKAKQFGGDFSGQQGPQGQGYYPQQGSGPLPQGLYPAMVSKRIRVLSPHISSSKDEAN